MATSRQFGQRARRDREHQHKRPAAQPTNRKLAQRAHRNREHLFGQQLPTRTQLSQRALRNREHEPIARQPLPPQLAAAVSRRHRLGPCDVPCSFCGAEHGIEEKAQGSSKIALKFSTYCHGGAVVMEKFHNPLQLLHSLLIDSTPDMFPFLILLDHQPLHNSIKRFEIITTRSLSVSSVSRQIHMSVDLEEYTRFVFRVNCGKIYDINASGRGLVSWTWTIFEKIVNLEDCLCLRYPEVIKTRIELDKFDWLGIVV